MASTITYPMTSTLLSFKLFINLTNCTKVLQILSDLKKTFQKSTFSQAGEDIILKRIFADLIPTPIGIYVDIGAFHPYKYSNTALLYEKGWRGINIDVTPGSMELFTRERPDDINLEIGVSHEPGNSNLYLFKDFPAQNSLSKPFLRKTDIIKNQTGEVKVKLEKLENILKVNLKDGKEIDLLNVDTEGYDHSVLLSHNWSKYPVKVVIVEVMLSDPDSWRYDPTYTMLLGLGFKKYAQTVVAKNVFSVVFINQG